MKFDSKLLNWILLIAGLIVFVVGVSWLIYSEDARKPENFIYLLGAAFVDVFNVAANAKSIFFESEEKKITSQTNVNSVNIVADKVEAEKIAATIVEHQENYYLSPEPEKESEQELLPRRPKRGVIPPPGELPPGSRPCPFGDHNRLFTGREKDLLALAEKLLYTEVNQAIVLTGMGGIGKTQTAVEFCCCYGRYFEGVHWISALADINGEIADCGRLMDLQPWPEKTPDQVGRTLHAWSCSRRRLVILDNLEDPQMLREWLPKLKHCRVLVTARHAEWPPDLELMEHKLYSLEPAESRSLLRNLAARLNNVEDSHLNPINEYLGGLPLALDLAGRYLQDREHLDPVNFLDELKKAQNLLDHTALANWSKLEDSPTSHLPSLAATFQLSWQRLAGDEPPHPTARLIFALVGFCAPSVPIPEDLLQKSASLEDTDLDRGLKRLYSLGLLERSQTGPLIHPLLSAFARSMITDEKPFLAALAGELAKMSSNTLESELPTNYLPLLPHLEKLCSMAEKVGAEAAGTLWNNLGRVLQDQGDLAGAKVCLQRALRIDEQVYGLDHPEVATDVNNLGLVLQEQGDLTGAKKFLQHALSIDEKAFGPNHPDVARDLNNLGSVLREQGDLTGAKKCFECALRIDEQVYGPDHPEIATDVNNLGLVLRDQGDLAGAKKCYESALSIEEKSFGPDHPEVAIAVNNLGSVLRDLGDLAGAKECFKRALSIDEKAFGLNHPNVARDVNNLGSVLQDQGDLAGAKKCHERALFIDEKVIGPDHPNVARDINNLGGVLLDQGDLAGAKECFERALRIYEKVYGPDHPKVATVANNLGMVLQDQGDLAGAKKCFERALRVDEQVYGPDYPKVATVVNNLGLVLRDQGDLSGAKKCFERALRINEKAFGPGHPDVARDLNHQGGVLHAQGDLDGAKECFESALSIRKKVYGPDHPKVATTVNNLGSVLYAQGDLDGAIECFERALSIDERVYGLDNPNVATDVNNLGGVLYAQGDLEGAKKCSERALRILENSLGPEHSKTQFVRKILEDLNNSW